MPQFQPLQLYPLPTGASYFEPVQELPTRIEETSPAILVLTDLRRQAAVTIEPGVSIDWALRRMKPLGVRLLFVVGTGKEVLGVITASDIQGEKPVRLYTELGLRRSEMVVRDIMTPREELEALHVGDVLHALVGDILATLRSVGRQHALVLDDEPRYGQLAIRGIFSAAQISKQIGRPIDLPKARTASANARNAGSGSG